MLVRNLRKKGDLQRSYLSQEENLKLAIANDRLISNARAMQTKGQLPVLSPMQLRSKEEELTDAIAIQAKARENLLQIFTQEQVSKFMEGLTTDSMTYLNVYWSELKPLYSNKSGLNKLFFDRILRKHIDGITDSRGMSTVPTTAYKSVSLNELAELKRLGFDWMLTDPLLKALNSKLQRIASATAVGSPQRSLLDSFEMFRSLLPTQAVFTKVEALPEGQRGAFYNRLINMFAGTNPEKSAWEAVFDLEGRDFITGLSQLFPIVQRAEIQQLYAETSIGAKPIVARPVLTADQFRLKTKSEKVQILEDIVKKNPSAVIEVKDAYGKTFEKTSSPLKKPSTKFAGFNAQSLDDAYERYIT